MTVRSAFYYWVVCDNCGTQPEHEDTKIIQDTEANAIADAHSVEYRAINGLHFCEDCRVPCAACDSRGCDACRGIGCHPVMSRGEVTIGGGDRD